MFDFSVGVEGPTDLDFGGRPGDVQPLPDRALKEGISLNKVLSGYDGWTSERFTFSDAAIPLLTDGIKWMGYVPEKTRASGTSACTPTGCRSGEAFSSYGARSWAELVYLKMEIGYAGSAVARRRGLHIGKPEDDTLQLKSKPEVFESPNFIDTGSFPRPWGRSPDSRSTIATARGRTAPSTSRAGQLEQANDPLFHGGGCVRVVDRHGRDATVPRTDGTFGRHLAHSTGVEGRPAARSRRCSVSRTATWIRTPEPAESSGASRRW